jgi:hypothetical protein
VFSTSNNTRGVPRGNAARDLEKKERVEGSSQSAGRSRTTSFSAAVPNRVSIGSGREELTRIFLKVGKNGAIITEDYRLGLIA